jgi:hypothetical protein
VSDVRRLLESGEHGVRWTPPAGEVLRETEREVVLRDAGGLRWQLSALPAPFGLAPEEDEALAADLQLSARSAFEGYWNAHPKLTIGARPRSDDLSWTPLIESSVATIGSGRCLRVMRWLAFAPGDEAVVGQLIVPVAQGTVEARVLSRDAHPMSRVRAALDAAAAGLEIVAPPAPPGEVVLEDAGCAFVPPPRFRLEPGLKAAPGQRVFYRAGLDGWRRILDVWRLGVATLKEGIDPRPSLAARADSMIEAWTREGCEEIKTVTRPIGDFRGCPQVAQYVQFKVRGGLSHTLHRWWLEPDGTCYRIGTNGPPAVSELDLHADVEAIQASWRLL